MRTNKQVPNVHVEKLNEGIGLLVATLPDCLFFKDGEGRWIYANSPALTLFQISDVDYVGKRDSELSVYAPFFRDAFLYCEETDEQVWTEGKIYQGEEHIPQPDGSTRIFNTIKIPTFHQDGSRNTLIVVGREITEYRQMLNRVEENSQRYQSLFQNNPNAVYSLDLNRCFTSVNREMEAMCGYTAEQMIGQPPSMVVVEDDLEICKSAFAAALNGVYSPVEVRFRTSRGDIIDVHAHEMPIIVHGETVGVYGIAEDISEQKRTKEVIRHMAYHDSLTDLPNRVLLMEKIDEALTTLETGRHVALLFVDLDHFKTVNDTMGHSVGDALLKEVARRLGDCLQPHHTLCRLGGDEFVVLLPNVSSRKSMSDVAKQIIDTLANPYEILGQLHYLTGSVGIALASDSSTEAEGLLRKADIAMYQAKTQGKNHYQFFNDELESDLQKRYTVGKELRSAVTNHEFVLFYQPMVDKLARVCGAEALVRWIRPTGEMVPPGEFIGVAEESGIIVTLSEWVLETACQQVRLWHESGYNPPRISVNVSPRQFRDKAFVGKVRRVLEETGVKGEWLGIEITEGTVVDDADYAQMTLKSLRELGIKVSIDDFGTGYSSLNRLKRLPIDRVKIDKSFIDEITNDQADVAIARTIIQLAKNLGLSAVAEGVETREQLDILLKQGCDEFQGYYFGKPVSHEEFPMFLEAAREK